MDYLHSILSQYTLTQIWFTLAMSISATTACVAAAVLWVIWKTLRDYIVPSALDKVPGPQRQSFWLGKKCSPLRCLQVLTMPSLNDAYRKYGGVLWERGLGAA